MLPTTRHSCDISSKEAVLPRRNDADMGPANSIHVWRNTANVVKNLIKTALIFLFLSYYQSENLPQMKFGNTGHGSNKQNAQSTSPIDHTRENLVWNAFLTIRSKDN